MWNRSSFYSLIKPMVPSSFWGRRYHRSPESSLPMPKGFDLEPKEFSLFWPWLKITPSCETITSTTNLSTSCEKLGPGMILLRNYISIKDQVNIVNICEKWGARPEGFYEPSYPKEEEVVPYLYMMCFGRNWDPITRYQKQFRSDGSEPPLIPSELISLSEAAIQDAQAHLDDLPSMRPDTCLVNFYEPAFAHSFMRQDLHESSDSLQRGLPVVSIFIGKSALFLYGDTDDEKKSSFVVLETGDVLIYGGKSRPIFFKLQEIFGVSSSDLLHSETPLRSGLLNLTLKQF